ncbi:hypothetical protein B0H10DRAFT_2214877 [Mycena sp. CBHHK59/15]|nr:hypothetical protein B0H10DRAFT_2214877 [Mycena sp. CBHHK59/15]
MSDASYDPSSDPPGFCISQAHQSIHDERKHECWEGRRQDAIKRPKIHEYTPEPPIKRELSEPLSLGTPRPSALQAKETIALQYAGALNSQMGDNTYVED